MPNNKHPEDIKAAIRKTGITLEELGEKTNVPGNTVRKSLYVPCPKGNRVVAKYLGQTVHDLWPEWFDENGNRILSKTGSKHTSRQSRGHGQKRRAA